VYICVFVCLRGSERLIFAIIMCGNRLGGKFSQRNARAATAYNENFNIAFRLRKLQIAYIGPLSAFPGASCAQNCTCALFLKARDRVY